MPLVEFPYTPFPIPPSPPFPAGQVALRPIVAAVLTSTTGRRFRCPVCLDSGADHCVFPAAFAPHLGIDLNSLPWHFTGGVGTSQNPTYYVHLSIDLGRGIQFDSYVGFTPAMDALGMGLLGQTGFFDYYKVCFFQRQGKFTIETT